MEGYLFGIPSMAFSQVDKGWGELEAAAQKAREMVLQMQAQQWLGGNPWLLNINIPNLPLEAMRPLKLCRLGRRHAAERVITQNSPRGETMYWIGSAGAAKDDSDGTDFHATFEGHMSVTPLHVDLTEHASLPGGENMQSPEQLARSLTGHSPWLPPALARRWAHSYGSRSWQIIEGVQNLEQMGEDFGADLYQREVDYLCRVEWAFTAEDILHRRSKLGLFLDASQQARLQGYLS